MEPKIMYFRLDFLFPSLEEVDLIIYRKEYSLLLFKPDLFMRHMNFSWITNKKHII